MLLLKQIQNKSIYYRFHQNQSRSHILVILFNKKSYATLFLRNFKLVFQNWYAWFPLKVPCTVLGWHGTCGCQFAATLVSFHSAAVRVKTGHMLEKSQQLLFFFNLLFHKQRNLVLCQIVIYRHHLFLGIYFSHQRTIAAKCTYYYLEIYFLKYPLST